MKTPLPGLPTSTYPRPTERSPAAIALSSHFAFAHFLIALGMIDAQFRLTHWPLWILETHRQAEGTRCNLCHASVHAISRFLTASTSSAQVSFARRSSSKAKRIPSPSATPKT
jgi:hypothetical protein